MPMKPLQTLVDEEYAKSSAADVAAAVAPLNAQITKLQADLAACEAGHVPPPDTQAPSVPTNANAAVNSSTQITFTWTASTDNVGVVQYEVSRNGALVGTRVGTSYVDSGLTPATAYSYTVRARDAAGNASALSAAVTATTSGTVTPPPTTWVKGSTSGSRVASMPAYTGPMEITTAGTVISGKTINGMVTIKADNVAIRDCLIKGFTFYGVLNENNKGMVVEYNDFDGRGSSKTKAIAFDDGIVRFNDIRGMVIGVEYWGNSVGVINNNYIHDLAEASTSADARHFDGIVCRGGKNLTIKDNAVDAPDGTASIFLTSQAGSLENVLVEGNLATGQASYTIYMEKASGAVINVRTINNHIERGIYGYILNSSNSVYTGNVEWQDGVNPVPAAVATWRAAT